MPKREKGVPAAAVPVEEMIVTVRGERAILDHDLARLYGVTAKALNQAVRRNPGRFPADFVPQLPFQEVTGLRSQTVTSNTAPDRSPSVTGSRLSRRLDELERRCDAQFKVVFDAIRQLMAPTEPRRRPVGFRVEEARPAYRVRRLRGAPSG